jgi:hypothetical protein
MKDYLAIHHFSDSADFYCLLKRCEKDEAYTDLLSESDKENSAFAHIRCPLCNWRPQKSSLWVCSSIAEPEFYFHGCGAVWNSFLTGGICQKCHHQWRYTSCHRCLCWSLHKDWYEKIDGKI